MITKNRQISILLIEDEEYDVRRIHNTIDPFREIIKIKKVVSDGADALSCLKSTDDIDVVIMDYQIYGGIRGEKLIRKIKEIDNTIEIIVVSKMTMNVTDFEFANKLLEAGAIWYCTKYPGDIEEYIYQPTDFILSIFNAYDRRLLNKEKLQSYQKLQRNVDDILTKKQIIGKSSAIKALRKAIDNSSHNRANVLVFGMSGTGKELVASNIHYNSDRKFENFVPVNCGSLPENLIESELFGFEKGAFTGADSQKKGLFEVANNGTIFLDEISELPLPSQAKLLRVIQEGEIDRIGRTQKIKVDVRIIAATNKDLRIEVKENRFREDLFYRLNVINVYVPELSERLGDIPLLVQYFMEHYCQEMNLDLLEITDEALTMLKQYKWPGNIRQLQNIIQRLIFSGKKIIDSETVNSSMGQPEVEISEQEDFLMQMFNSKDIIPWRDVEFAFQEKYFRFVRDNTNSDAEAARQLGMAPPNYHRVCKKLGFK